MSKLFYCFGSFAVLFSSALALSSTARGTGEGTSLQLALNWKPEPQFGGFYAAQVQKDYEKNGLKVEVMPGGAGTPVVQMVASGTVDFGIASADEVVIARSHGADVVALFAAYRTNPQGIMTHPERNFKSLRDVYENPGTLAMQKALPYALYLQKKFSAQANGSDASKHAQIVPYLGGISGFLNDSKYSQQCFVTSEPLTVSKQGGHAKTFLVADEGYNPYTTVLITRDDVLKKRPAVVKALVAAVRAGWRGYLDHPEETNKLMAGLNKAMDLATFAASADAQKLLIEPDPTHKSSLGKMTEQRWKALVSQLIDLKIINKPPATSSLYVDL